MESGKREPDVLAAPAPCQSGSCGFTDRRRPNPCRRRHRLERCALL